MSDSIDLKLSKEEAADLVHESQVDAHIPSSILDKIYLAWPDLRPKPLGRNRQAEARALINKRLVEISNRAVNRPIDRAVLDVMRAELNAMVADMIEDASIPDWIPLNASCVERDKEDLQRVNLLLPMLLRCWLMRCCHKTSVPVHSHDCDSCIYLGCVPADVKGLQWDLYFHSSASGCSTVIARFGDGPDYVSGIEVAKQQPEQPLGVALQLARERKLLHEQ